LGVGSLSLKSFPGAERALDLPQRLGAMIAEGVQGADLASVANSSG